MKCIGTDSITQGVIKPTTNICSIFHSLYQRGIHTYIYPIRHKINSESANTSPPLSSLTYTIGTIPLGFNSQDQSGLPPTLYTVILCIFHRDILMSMLSVQMGIILLVKDWVCVLFVSSPDFLDSAEEWCDQSVLQTNTGEALSNVDNVLVKPSFWRLVHIL